MRSKITKSIESFYIEDYGWDSRGKDGWMVTRYGALVESGSQGWWGQVYDNGEERRERMMNSDSLDG